MWSPFLLLILHFNGILCTIKHYNRSIVQAKYPNFGTKWIPLYQDDGSVIVGYFHTPEDNETVRFSLTTPAEEATIFTLYNQNYPQGINITEKNLNVLDVSKPLKFVTHGWMSSGDADTCQTIKSAYLDKGDVNVIIVDWGGISENVFYPIPMRSTSDVGDYYGSFLRKIIDRGMNAKNIHLVGHSLGAHVSGFAARKVKNSGDKIGRISALDPALPGFQGLEMVSSGKLEKEDADFVDVIHTCAGFLGYGEAIGHADFFPNGGRPPQPGCGNVIEMIESCSHGRSWKFFQESIVASEPFLARKCNSMDFNNANCNGEMIPMGEPTPETARGIYYLETLADPPYILSDNSRANNRI